ncbi:hypothetical protein QJS10_CPA03g01520 [Acorus calamus]|uniref:Integral membrane bound transporter domain-containing protein n=1 Tax=Acorus calamus TaxID=4465 RepID=A0AAV9F8K8_ACOCL|nr:hypothetical protein QJS10_CPA03g01520 [Acorus calamus]
MNTSTTTTSTFHRHQWRSVASSALRTASACVLIGCATIYFPSAFRRQLSSPALSYSTAIIITGCGDATLGDAVAGAVDALLGVAQATPPAALGLFLIKRAVPRALRAPLAAPLMVAVIAFLVAMGGSQTRPVVKRVALGQTVIAYATAFDRVGRVSGGAELIMQPVRVGASALIGATAVLITHALPYPRLACREARKNSSQFTNIMMEKARLLVKAFCADNKDSADAYISQARSLSCQGAKLLQHIKLKQASIQWETPKIILPTNCRPLLPERLQALETPLKGMELSLINTHSFPIKTSDHQNLNHLLNTPPETVHLNFPTTRQDLPLLFFLFCMDLFKHAYTSLSACTTETRVAPSSATDDNTTPVGPTKQKPADNNHWFDKRRLTEAVWCALTLGLAYFLGTIYSPGNGHWAGLIVATGLTLGREPTFKLANLKALGTALGSIYGVFGLLISEHLMELRFLVLLPWIIFTGFLRKSRMYGQAGATTAVVSALIVLGRRNYGTPTKFALMRVSETFIGLFCSILVDLVSRPTRASTLAKKQVRKCLASLRECIGAIRSLDIREQQKKLSRDIGQLCKFIEEAEAEPNFWFLPFPGACYKKALNSLSKASEFLLFMTYVMKKEEFISEVLELFVEEVSLSLSRLEEVLKIKSLSMMDANEVTSDIESGKGSGKERRQVLGMKEEEMERILDGFLEHCREVTERTEANEGEEGSGREMVLRLSTLGFCIHGLMRGTREIEMGLQELLQKENPSSHINLCEIYYKIREVNV